MDSVRTPYARCRSFVAFASFALSVSPAALHAACNVIPGTRSAFRGALGSIDRPFARPGDWVAIGNGPQVGCSTTGPEFGVDADAVAVTVAFRPAAGGEGRLVVLATDAAQAAVASEVARCRAHGAIVDVVTVNGAGVSRGLDVSDHQLRFRFPDTDPDVAGLTDGIGLAGPTAIAVTGPGEELPCDLVATPCSGRTDVLACVDSLYDDDGVCGSTPHPVFRSFTALPPSNDFQHICADPGLPVCDGGDSDLRIAVDADGNLLVPIDWRGVLVNRNEIPVARLLSATIGIEAFAGGGQPVRIPDAQFLGSYAPNGGKLPPVFDPQVGGTSAALGLFGSADAPDTVLRIARRSPDLRICGPGGPPCTQASGCAGNAVCPTPLCSGGPNDGQPCSSDLACPLGACGSATGLFDFATRTFGHVGPAVLRKNAACDGAPAPATTCVSAADCPGALCDDFTLAAHDPVPLDGLNQTAGLNAFVQEEKIQSQDLDDDVDTRDHVVRLARRDSGTPLSLSGFSGRAVSRIRDGRFSYPAIAAEGDLVAFLEPESGQGPAGGPGFTDSNQNGQVFENILRAYRRTGDVATDLLAGANITVDAAPLVGGRPVTVAGGYVLFRRAEASEGRQTTRRVNPAPPSSNFAVYPTFSPDGLALTYGLNAPEGFFSGVVLTPLDALGTVAPLSPGAGEGFALNGGSYPPPAMSTDGRWVAFFSSIGDPEDTNVFNDVFLRDRCLSHGQVLPGCVPSTRRISRTPDGSSADGSSFAPVMSSDGRFIAFRSEATNLAPCFAPNGSPLPSCAHSCTTEANVSVPCQEIYLQDRDADGNGIFDETGGVTMERIAVTSDEELQDGALGEPSMTPDGRWVAFESTAFNLGGALNNIPYKAHHIFARDRATGTTTRLDIDSFGRPQDESFYPFFSGDGHYLFFHGAAADTACTTERIDWRTGAIDCALPPQRPVGDEILSGGVVFGISTDGRFLLESIQEADTRHVCRFGNVCTNNLVIDLLTGDVVRSSVTADGNVPSGDAESLTLSPDGRLVGFGTSAPDVVVPDPAPTLEIYLRGPAGNPSCQIANCQSDPACQADLNCDGDLGDTLLSAVDSTTGQLLTIASVTEAAVAVQAVGGAPTPVVAFLRPENADRGGSSLNGDADTDDEVVHLWSPATGVIRLDPGVAATAVATSADWVAALVSEAGEETDLDGDGLKTHTVVEVHSTGGGSWTRLHLAGSPDGIAATRVAAAGDAVAFATLDGRVGVYHPSSGTGVAHLVVDGTGRSQPAEEFVLGEHLLAFRTREADLCSTPVAPGACVDHPGCICDLDGDGDCCDGVLQVVDLDGDRLVNTTAAVTPCRLEACDPALPYRVGSHTVTFLTFEPDQGCTTGSDCIGGARDLNGNGDARELVLQTLNVAATPVSAAVGVGRSTATGGPAVMALAATPVGVCTKSGRPCASDEPQSDTCRAAGDGRCYIPPGQCLRPKAPAQFCSIFAPNCPTDAPVCLVTAGSPPSTGVCHERVASNNPIPGAPFDCGTNDDCSGGATCEGVRQDFQRLAAPLSTGPIGEKVFTANNRCVEPLAASPCDATACRQLGGFCTAAGACARDHGPCRQTADCPNPATAPGGATTCVAELLVATAADTDGDEIPDPFDNCPTVANPDQRDLDTDHVGDRCDAQSCGDGIRGAAEECDGSAADACAGGACDGACHCECGTVTTDPAKVSVSGARGGLQVRMQLPLDRYAGEPVIVHLDDDDSHPIAAASFATLDMLDRKGRSFGKVRPSDSLDLVKLQATKRPGKWTLTLRARGWFTAADANRPADRTRFTVTIGGRCFSHPVTKIR